MDSHTAQRVFGFVSIFLIAHHVITAFPCNRVPMRNRGDRHGLFLFLLPERYHGATLGPETYDFLVQRYGQATVDKANIFRAPSDSHPCGVQGWCKVNCGEDETIAWTLKDVCGRFHCCIALARQNVPSSNITTQ